MFRCTEGHLSKPGDKRILVPTALRSVTYRQWVQPKDRRKPKELGTQHGYETVREAPFCPDHAWHNKPSVENSDKVVWNLDIIDYSG